GGLGHAVERRRPRPLRRTADAPGSPSARERGPRDRTAHGDEGPGGLRRRRRPDALAAALRGRPRLRLHLQPDPPGAVPRRGTALTRMSYSGSSPKSTPTWISLASKGSARTRSARWAVRAARYPSAVHRYTVSVSCSGETIQ